MLKPKPRRASIAAAIGRAAQAAETRQRILDAGRAVFAATDYDQVSTAEIGARAGVSHSMINVYFGSKAGLLYALVRENNAGQFEAARAAAARRRSALARVEAIVATWAGFDLRHPRMLAAMQSLAWVWTAETEAENRAERAQHLALLVEVIEAGMATGELRRMPVERATGLVWDLYTMGLRPGVFEGWTPDQCVAEIAARIRAALGAP